MQLFYWENVKALAQYAPGYAFAYAADREQAISLIVEKYKVYIFDIYFSGECAQERLDALEKELRETSAQLFDTEAGFFILGSD